MSEQRTKPPAELIREAAPRAAEVDLPARTVRNTVTTRRLARDGGIVVPEGIVTRFFEQNPVVKIRHGLAEDARPLVAGRALSLTRTRDGLDALTQFADNQLGREWGYLYGLNEGGEVYLRAFSFGWSTLEETVWDLEQARAYLGELWDEEAVSAFSRRYNEVWVATKSEMHEYSVVEVGADREALMRAWREGGVEAAAGIVSRIDLAAARADLDALKESHQASESRIARLEADMQALARNGKEAARPGNSSELRDELRELLRLAGLRPGNPGGHAQ
jgi:hypothetical protein